MYTEEFSRVDFFNFGVIQDARDTLLLNKAIQNSKPEYLSSTNAYALK